METNPINLKIVEYDKWCQKCKSKNVKEYDEPCNGCLAEGVQENGLPLNFKKEE